MAPSPYEIPQWGGSGDRLLGFLLEAVSEGDGWLQNQRPQTEWTKIMEMLGPSLPNREIEGMSNTGFNLVERNARDLVASLSNFRHDGEFKPTFDKALYGQAHVLTKLDRHWYTETDAYEVYRDNLQNAVTFGTGYLMEDWDKSFHGDHGDIRLRAFGPSDVTFVQLPKNHDIQQAYMVLIREELPLHLAKRQYPNIAPHLAPDRENAGWIQKGLRAVQQFMSPALRVGGTGTRSQSGSFPTVDIFHAYTMDGAINESALPVKMGAFGTNWSYTVPALGDPINVGVINPATGQPFTRPAEDVDCRLFPLRRYTVFSRTAVAYDGSSPWWHGKTPVARTRFNDWAWQALGKSLLGDARTMQDGIIALMRYIEDACAARLDPPALYDDTLVSEGFANNFNPRLAGSRAQANLNSGGEVLKFPVPVAHYDVPNGIFDWIKQQEGRINHQMGTPDLVAMAKAKQVPGEGTLEKLREMAGPLVQDMIRASESPLRQLGEWRKAYYLQFYTHARMIQITGDDEIQEDYEYTPDKLVPYITGESTEARQQRAKEYLSQFKYQITESGLNEMHRMVNKLALLQLKKAGIPIDRWTVYKAWQIPNVGPEPEGTHNLMERVRAEEVMAMEHAEEMAKMQAQVGGGQVGRPPTNARPPQIVNKDHGTRQTVKTS